MYQSGNQDFYNISVDPNVVGGGLGRMVDVNIVLYINILYAVSMLRILYISDIIVGRRCFVKIYDWAVFEYIRYWSNMDIE